MVAWYSSQDLLVSISSINTSMPTTATALAPAATADCLFAAGAAVEDARAVKFSRRLAQSVPPQIVANLYGNRPMSWKGLAPRRKLELAVGTMFVPMQAFQILSWSTHAPRVRPVFLSLPVVLYLTFVRLGNPGGSTRCG